MKWWTNKLVITQSKEYHATRRWEGSKKVCRLMFNVTNTLQKNWRPDDQVAWIDEFPSLHTRCFLIHVQIPNKFSLEPSNTNGDFGVYRDWTLVAISDGMTSMRIPCVVPCGSSRLNRDSRLHCKLHTKVNNPNNEIQKQETGNIPNPPHPSP